MKSTRVNTSKYFEKEHVICYAEVVNFASKTRVPCHELK